MKANIIIIMLGIGVLVGCKTQISPTTVSYQSKESNDHFDFGLIGQWVKDKRIVALGESTHGIGEYYALKSAIVQYLHKELGFEILVFEGGFGDINLVWLHADELNHIAIRDKSLFSNFRCQEVVPLFEYIKSKHKGDNPLIFAGMDPQISGSFKIRSIVFVLFEPAN
ncbi:MAG: erythromycin esterase family protein [Saprospiraceae bacterium]